MSASRLVSQYATLDLCRHIFDTLFISGIDVAASVSRAAEKCINLRQYNGGVVIALDECTTEQDLLDLAAVFDAELVSSAAGAIPELLTRTSPYLTHETFSSYHSETDAALFAQTGKARFGT